MTGVQVANLPGKMVTGQQMAQVNGTWMSLVASGGGNYSLVVSGGGN